MYEKYSLVLSMLFHSLVSVYLLFNGTFAEEHDKPTLVFDRLGNNAPQVKAAKTIKDAYESIGYQVKYETMPLIRSYREANEGRLDGLQGRVEKQSLHYPNLIKIDVPLIDFEVVVIADRGQCGECHLDKIKTAATVNGYAALSLCLEDSTLPFKPIYLTNRLSVQRLFDAKRVEAMILSDVLLAEQYFTEPDKWRVFHLCKKQTFHYLHKRHEALVSVITQRLEEIIKAQSDDIEPISYLISPPKR